ncbi:hypothetical protein PVK06_020473 [Gossypium arboreum]|uniref:Uncharacterized protein n=1 Tax=Gossypium arboreum TaxID=29729 RepID=A0ABR0PMG7_GOSAR|nr:hypothetical protein PVK06_020473 [Gossypium arboreum]
MEEGVGGRGCMKDGGVLGGSILGITLVHASVNVASAEGAASRSVEKGLPLAAKKGRRATSLDARHNILGRGWCDHSVIAESEIATEKRGRSVSFFTLFCFGTLYL